MSSSPLFTIFTPTYNRAHTIQRVFDSLCNQTLRDFEWLVIDDGSTDETPQLVAAWINVANFPIRYFRQDHSGKHFAHNLGVREARGFFFAPVDSDDALVSNALERIAQIWNGIPAELRSSFSGAGGLCRNQRGEIVGDHFPYEPFDVNYRDRRYIHRIRGEKWGVTSTEILRQFPLPEIRGTNFVPEGVLGSEIGKTYKSRNVNEIFRVYYTNDRETGATLSKRNRLSADNAPGRLYYYVYLLNNDLEYFVHSPMPFLKAAVMLPIVAWFSDAALLEILRSLKAFRAKGLVLVGLPIALLFYGAERIRNSFIDLKVKRASCMGNKIGGN